MGNCPILEYRVERDIDKGDRPGSDNCGFEPSLTEAMTLEENPGDCTSV